MKKVYVFLADGFETVEALAPVDVMRRAGLDVVTVSIMGRKDVVSAQNVTVVADELYETIACAGADAVKAGAHAGKLVSLAASVTGGKGGGRPDNAQAGGKDVAKVDEALAAVKAALA